MHTHTKYIRFFLEFVHFLVFFDVSHIESNTNWTWYTFVGLSISLSVFIFLSHTIYPSISFFTDANTLIHQLIVYTQTRWTKISHHDLIWSWKKRSCVAFWNSSLYVLENDRNRPSRTNIIKTTKSENQLTISPLVPIINAMPKIELPTPTPDRLYQEPDQNQIQQANDCFSSFIHS